MKQMKRTLSLVLALVMLLSLGTTAFAGEVEEPVQAVEEVAQPVQPVEEAPVEEAPAAEAPVEEAPAAETPAEEVPAAETPVEEAPVAEAPVEEAPAAEAPVEEAPAAEAPAVEQVAEEEETAEEPTVVSYPAVTFPTVFVPVGIRVDVSAEAGALPEGTELRVTQVPVHEVADQVAEVTEGEILFALDIAFWNDGVEIEPVEKAKVSVSIKSAAIAAVETVEVVHIDSQNEVTTVEQDEDTAANEAAFTTDSFSVYIIVNGEEQPPVTVTYRRTYKFTRDGSTPFEFYDKAGVLTDNQIVKNGDKLEKVTIPYSASHTFQNWIVSASDDPAVAVDTEVNLPMEINDIGEADTTVTLKPAYGNVFYVTFHGYNTTYPNAEEVDVIRTKKIVVEGENVVIGDVQGAALDESHIFYGWTTDPAGLADPVLVYDADHKLIADTEYPDAITADLDLYPYYVDAFWLRYVSGPVGSRASYVPAQFVLASETLTKLPVPTRAGYLFQGWYTGSMTDNVITYGDQVTDSQGNVVIDGGLKLTEETVLYGMWEADSNSSYKVVIWRQKVTDDKSAADSAKTYDYAASEIRTGYTDAPVAASDADKGLGGSGDYVGFHFSRTVQTSETIRADGATVINVYYDRDLMAVNFYYLDGAQPEGAQPAYTYTATTSDSGTQYGVDENGNYVQLTRGADQPTTRVYYTYDSWGRRYEYSGTFYTRSGNNWWSYNYTATQYNGSNLPPAGDNTTYYTDEANGRNSLTRRTETSHHYEWTTPDGQPYTGTRYTRSTVSGYPYMVTWTGLYGQSFAQNGYTWPSNRHWNEDPDGYGTTQTLQDAFNNTNNPYNLYDQGTPGNYVIHHYKQGLDGKYSNSGTLHVQVYGSGGSFTFQNKFDGFKVNSYNTGNNGFNTNGGSNTNMNDHPNTYPLHVYHLRNKWNIDYQVDNAQGIYSSVHTESGIYFEAKLDDYNLSLEDAGVPEREHYTFTGWYADETCTQLYDFSSTMPNANVTVYAGFEPVFYQVIVDPDGGVITPDIGSTYFWKQYGDTFDRYEIKREFIEDPNGSYYYNYVAGENDPDGNIKVRTATYDTTGSGTKYRPMTADDDKYVLVGWYVVDANDETTETPYDFNAEVSAPVKIRAVWSLAGDYGLQYNPTAIVGEGDEAVVVSGTFTQSTPEARYADGAEIVVDAPVENITGPYIFDGWEIVEPNVEGTQGAVLDDNGGNFYKPGDALKINAAAWARNRIINLRAHYTIVESSDEPVTVTYLKYDPNFPTGATGTVGEATEPQYYPLNTKIALGTDAPSDYACYGYVLVGWSQDKNAEPVVHAEGAGVGSIVFGLSDEVGVDGLTPTEKATITVTGEDGKETTKEVACNILYAVWEQQNFYVYHSGVAGGAIETIPMPASGTYDLTATPKGLTANTLYGGYYLADGFTAPAVDEETGKPTETCAAYDGDNWTWTTPETVNGKAMTPVADTTYYIKEVPAAKYLQVYTHYTYTKADNKITNLWMISDVDDINYDETGVVITVGNESGVCKSLTVKNAVGSASVKLTPQRLFAKQKVTSSNYLTYLDVGVSGKLEHAQDGVAMVMYWITPDGLMVTGTAQRTLSNVATTSISHIDATVTPGISDPSAG